MTAFAAMTLPPEPTHTAPDGLAVRELLRNSRCSVAHFELPAGKTANCVTHCTVEEIWYIVSGRGEMWREQDGRGETLALGPGTCLTIPLGTRFQTRNTGAEPLCAIGVTTPPWPDDPGEAYPVEGPWEATVG